MRFLLLSAFVILISGPAQVQSDPDLPLDKINLPDGFSIEVYVEDVPNARSLSLSPNGTLFIGTRKRGGSPVYAVTEVGGERKVHAITPDLNIPNGVAFRNGDLYVAEISRILRYDDIEAHLDNPPEPVVVNDKLPTDGWHGWKYIAFGPDGKLYVPVGAPCNTCDREYPYSSILRMNADGSGVETYAYGVRNTVGFDWHPQTGELWFTDNGPDNMGDDIPDCELNRVTEAGQHFGFPHYHAGDVKDKDFGAGHSPDDFVKPVLNLGAHVAPLGIEFYTGSQFPASYRGNAFIAQHGSWNRSSKVGYRLMSVSFDDQGRVKSYDVFADGWMENEENWGRPVDIETLPDGSLLLSDDQAGVVYRIYYSGS